MELPYSKNYCKNTIWDNLGTWLKNLQPDFRNFIIYQRIHELHLAPKKLVLNKVGSYERFLILQQTVYQKYGVQSTIDTIVGERNCWAPFKLLLFRLGPL